MNTDALNSRINEFFEEEGGVFLHITNPKYPADYGFYFNFLHPFIQRVGAGRTQESVLGRPTPVLAYINNSSFNAAAARSMYIDDDRVYYIGINAGTVYLLERLFFTMLANPDVMTGIGNPNQEVRPEKLNKILYSDANLFLQPGLSLNYPKPVDSTRTSTARLLTALALLFLTMHELAHILNGHVDHLNRVGNNRLIQERFISPEDQAECLLRQTIEFDADAIGICDTVNSVLEMAENPQFMQHEFNIQAPRETLIGLAAFATYAVFKLFSDHDNPNTPLAERSYPSFGIRRKLMTSTIVSLILEKVKIGRFDEGVGKSIIDQTVYFSFHAEAAFSQIDSETSAFSKLIKDNIVHSSAEMEHIALLKSNFQVIRPDLQKLAYAKLYQATG